MSETLSAGTSYNITVSSSLMVLSEAAVSGVTVVSGGSVYDNGGLLSNLTISGGDNFYGLKFAIVLVSQGIVSDVTDTFGVLSIRDGGTATNVDLSAGGLLYIAEQAVASNVSVTGSGTPGFILNDGGHIESATVNALGQLDDAFGALESVTVNAGGGVFLGYPAFAFYSDDGTLLGGGSSAFQYSENPTILGITVNDGGAVSLLSGYEHGAIIESGGLQNNSGGVEYSVLINSGGKNVLLSTTSGSVGIASASEVYGGTELDGGSAISSLISNGGFEYVDGYALSTQVLSGGALVVQSNGAVYDGGAATYVFTKASSGGTDFAATVSSGGLVIVQNGGKNISTSVLSAGLLDVEGGTDISTTISAGATELVSGTGAEAFAPVVSSGGTLIVENGGFAYNISANSGSLIIISGGVGLSFASGTNASDVSIKYFGEVTLSSGVLSDTVVTSGATLNVDGDATLSNAIIYGTVIVEDSGKAISSTVLNGGTIINDASFATSGSLFYTNVDAGGLLENNGSSISAVINDGGTGLQGFLQYGDDTGIVINSGGTDLDYGYTNSAIINNGGTEEVISYENSNPYAEDITVESGGFLEARNSDTGRGNIGADVDSVVVQSGGLVLIGPFAEISGAVIQNGGVVIVATDNASQNEGSDAVVAVTNSGLRSYSSQVSGLDLGQGNSLYVLPGGTVFGATVQGASVTMEDGGSLISLTELSGSVLSISGGVAYDTTISSGGDLTIYGAHLQSNVIFSAARFFQSSIFSGTQVYGKFEVSGGAEAIGTDVFSGGSITERGGGTSESVILSGGVDLNSGITSGEIISTGGSQSIFGGTALRDVVLKGGIVFDDGIISAATIQSGAIAIVVSNASAVQTTVEQGGILFAMSGAFLSGISGTVVSSGIIFTSGGSVQIVNGLTPLILSNNADEYITTDGYVSGTVVDSGGTQFLFGGVASNTDIDGGIQIISAGTAYDTIISGGTQSVSGGTDWNTTLAGGTLILSGGTISGAITFLGSGSVFKDGGEQGQLGGIVISSFASGDSIDFSRLRFSSGNETVSGNSIYLNSNQITILGAASDNLVAVNDGDGGTLLEVAPLCFLEGTRIATPVGERNVESLGNPPGN
jgi:autotransporter passenger strand-loop-strand repeat protein